MENNNNLLNCILLISTFLIVGKALGFLSISWIFAFGPLLLLFASFVLILVIGSIILWRQYKKQEDEED